MPLIHRTVTPVKLSASKLKLDKNDSEFIAVNNGTLVNVLRQLASLVANANEIFSGVALLSDQVGKRVRSVKLRLDELEAKAELFDPKLVPVPEGNLDEKNICFRIRDVILDTDIISTSTRPRFLLKLYDRAGKHRPQFPLRSPVSTNAITSVSVNANSGTPTSEEANNQSTNETAKRNNSIEGRRPASFAALRDWKLDDYLDEKIATLRNDPKKLSSVDDVCRVVSSKFPSQMVQVDVTGRGFDRMKANRRSLVIHTKKVRKVKKRRNTICGTMPNKECGIQTSFSSVASPTDNKKYGIDSGHWSSCTSSAVGGVEGVQSSSSAPSPWDPNSCSTSSDFLFDDEDRSLTPQLENFTDGMVSDSDSVDTEGYFTSFRNECGFPKSKKTGKEKDDKNSSGGTNTENEYELFGKGSTSTTASSCGTVVLRNKPDPPARTSSSENLDNAKKSNPEDAGWQERVKRKSLIERVPSLVVVTPSPSCSSGAGSPPPLKDPGSVLEQENKHVTENDNENDNETEGSDGRLTPRADFSNDSGSCTLSDTDSDRLTDVVDGKEQTRRSDLDLDLDLNRNRNQDHPRPSSTNSTASSTTSTRTLTNNTTDNNNEDSNSTGSSSSSSNNNNNINSANINNGMKIKTSPLPPIPIHMKNLNLNLNLPQPDVLQGVQQLQIIRTNPTTPKLDSKKEYYSLDTVLLGSSLNEESHHDGEAKTNSSSNSISSSSSPPPSNLTSSKIRGARVVLDANGEILFSSETLRRKRRQKVSFEPGEAVKEQTYEPNTNYLRVRESVYERIRKDASEKLYECIEEVRRHNLKANEVNLQEKGYLSPTGNSNSNLNATTNLNLNNSPTSPTTTNNNNINNNTSANGGYKLNNNKNNNNNGINFPRISPGRQLFQRERDREYAKVNVLLETDLDSPMPPVMPELKNLPKIKDRLKRNESYRIATDDVPPPPPPQVVLNNKRMSLPHRDIPEEDPVFIQQILNMSSSSNCSSAARNHKFALSPDDRPCFLRRESPPTMDDISKEIYRFRKKFNIQNSSSSSSGTSKNSGNSNVINSPTSKQDYNIILPPFPSISRLRPLTSTPIKRNSIAGIGDISTCSSNSIQSSNSSRLSNLSPLDSKLQTSTSSSSASHQVLPSRSLRSVNNNNNDTSNNKNNSNKPSSNSRNNSTSTSFFGLRTTSVPSSKFSASPSTSASQSSSLQSSFRRRPETTLGDFKRLLSLQASQRKRRTISAMEILKPKHSLGLETTI